MPCSAMPCCVPYLACEGEQSLIVRRGNHAGVEQILQRPKVCNAVGCSRKERGVVENRS